MTLRCATLLTPRRLKALSAAAFVWDVHEAPASDDAVVDTWIDFSTAEEGTWSGKGTAVIVQVDCGEEVMIETCKLFKKLPCGSTYKARLLRRTTVIPAELAEEASGYQVWVET